MIKLKKKAELKTAAWAGGTTTQLAIYPESAEYSKFNFDYRISYATVEIEESTFTFMPGVTRHLMILKGSLEIDHIDRYKKQLNKFDTDIFSGEWPTKAKGKVTDFNLMTKGKTEGALESIVLKTGVKKKIHFDQNEYLGIYLLTGSLQVEYERRHSIMETGDFILLTGGNNKDCMLHIEEDCEVVIARVRLPQ